MTVGHAFRFPPDRWEDREKLRKLSWASIVLLLLASVFIGLTVGQSQAMKTAWLSDMLTTVPPAALLVALRFELREPTPRFPRATRGRSPWRFW